MKHVAATLLAMPLLAGCPEALRAGGEVASDQIPMYGNVEKAQSLRLASLHVGAAALISEIAAPRAASFGLLSKRRASPLSYDPKATTE